MSQNAGCNNPQSVARIVRKQLEDCLLGDDEPALDVAQRLVDRLKEVSQGNETFWHFTNAARMVLRACKSEAQFNYLQEVMSELFGPDPVRLAWDRVISRRNKKILCRGPLPGAVSMMREASKAARCGDPVRAMALRARAAECYGTEEVNVAAEAFRLVFTGNPKRRFSLAPERAKLSFSG